MSSYQKTAQVAQYLLDRGVPMTARQMIAEGFFFEDMSEVNNVTVGACLTAICDNSRYVTEREYLNDGGRRMVAVRVRGILPEPKKPTEPSRDEMAMWRQLLTRKASSEICLSEDCV